ncbi:MAG TPA: MtrAB system histidine kinase MtrB [Jatrophihabitantaceae bacterium]|nr:MtrAB system histidine kinase MtrB [Jatrophihabitantaceae bacterium]
MTGRLVAPVVAVAARGWRRVVREWRRSLQLRVGASTVVVTGAVVLIIGLFLVNEISSGVLRAKRDAAIAQVDLGLQDARSTLASVDPGDISGITNALATVTTDLTATGSNAGLYTISIGTANAAVASLLSPQPPISAALRRVVQGGDLAMQYGPMPRPGAVSGTVTGLIVGEPVSTRTGAFELYYLFPLSAEQATVAIVQRTVLLAGIALVVFIALITLLVTRQVVRPVRVAAQTAERLAAGDLKQRIKVEGSDDIARLGQSFNEMAGSLQRQIRRLEELSRLQQRFTSDVSHELRTPLTTIRMAAELLHAHRADFAPALGRSAELLTIELDRFEALLADLLEISRYDAGAARLESELLDLRGVVASAVDASRVLAARHGSVLMVHAGDAPIPVEMDSRRVERILRNLIGNALDHGEGRPVIVTVGADDGAVAVTVRDHGVGLRPGEAGLVFNRFWRGDPSRSRLTGGTGLGLAISLEDARLHGGWLQAWGERGIGAQFRLTLPRRSGDTLDSSPLPLVPDETVSA